MTMYCLCEARNDEPDSQAFGAPNRYCAAENDIGQDGTQAGFPPLALMVPMKMIALGAQQVLGRDDPITPNDWSMAGRPAKWRKHYPNVDVFECPNCHARIAR